jgi:hypothetical protein
LLSYRERNTGRLVQGDAETPRPADSEAEGRRGGQLSDAETGQARKPETEQA